MLGVAGLIAFCIYEVNTTHATIVRLSLFANRSTSLVYLGAFCQGVVLWSMVYYMPEYFQAVKGYSPTVAGLAALPQTGTVVPSAIFVGITVGITGKYRWAIWAGWVLTTLGCGLLILLDVNTSIVAWVFLELVSGIGIGLLFPAIALAIQASAPQEDTAVAATFGTFFRYFGQTLGVAVGGTIFQNRIHTYLESIPSLAANATYYALNSVELVEELKLMPPDSPVGIQLRLGFADSYRTIWAVMCALAGVALIASLFIEEYDMNQEHLTEQGFVTGGKQAGPSVSGVELGEPAPTTESESAVKC